ncbi:hypothetical protein F5B19DRAFT_472196 [Rostrohypoxylon terebratum]|nr:hypothetical protein F5B19DRAFT_472196 [Rostrohypoxylon terebratum]
MGYYSLAGRSYGISPSLFNPKIFGDMNERVPTAKKLASLFRPIHDPRPDIIIIALTAAFSCLCPHSPGTLPEIYNLLLIHLHDELDFVQLPLASSGTLGLVNTRMYTRQPAQLKQLVSLLQWIEADIRSSDTGFLS